ncbi:MAG: protein-glutamate O-methyltransferase CheR [Desulfobulbaceae bacterium]
MESATRKIADLLEESIGLTVTSIGAVCFARALNNRKKALGIEGDEAYLDKLATSFMEMRRLVEEVVVPETWFFRDQEPFRFLTEHVFSSPKDIGLDIYRILSIPCSTGEEPYSIAMTLLQAGLKPTSFYIDAVDVSERSLAVARRGVYRENSFRTEDTEFRDNFFHKTEEGYSLNGLVREKVRFQRGNILQPGFLESLGVYDVVFCRNLLIYFNKESQEKAIRGLHKVLTPGGVLFSGHSEASLFVGHLFAPVPHSRAFAFYRKDPEKGPEQQEWKMPQPPVTRSRSTRNRSVIPQPASPATLASSSHRQGSLKFEDVERMADSGQLDEAARLCEKALRQEGPEARWYYLLGVIRDSQNEHEEALKYFRKAVYLDPNHAASLIQLALLAERSGNVERAENYRRRARMVSEKE